MTKNETPLSERLRNFGAGGYDDGHGSAIEAADEIDRLRTALERIVERYYDADVVDAGLVRIAREALSGEPPSPAEPSARRSGELLPCENCGHGIVAHVQNGGNCPTPPLKSDGQS